METIICEICGKELRPGENAYLWDWGTTCAKCFDKTFDQEYTRAAKADLIGVSILAANEITEVW